MDMYSSENHNPSLDPSEYLYALNAISSILFEDDYGDVKEDQLFHPPCAMVSLPLEEVFSHGDTLFARVLAGGNSSDSTNVNMEVTQNEARKPQGDALKPQRVAFKTKTKLNVLDDGYRWRKYGKKAVKNNPNLRNYYKCTSEGCQVKKKVERWVEDSCYVITQYVGIHTHESPAACYYNKNIDCQNA